MGKHSAAVKALIAAIIVLLIAAGVYFLIRDDESAPVWTKPAPTSAVQNHTKGGSVSVVVSTPPEMTDPGDGGVTLRTLTLPALFKPTANGQWNASLVEPGSDGAKSDGLTAWFKLRSAKWSNGEMISVADLRRTADARFVQSIDDADVNGRVTVHFKFKFPGWRQLWSSIAAPAADVYGGSYVVKSATAGLETDLQRVSDSTNLDEIKLVYVPDSITARQLLAAGKVDVVAPIGDTMRINNYQAIDGVNVSVSDKGGAWTALQVNATGSVDPNNAKMLSVFPRLAFTNSLLAGEASLLDGFATDDTTWKNYGAASGVSLNGVNKTFTAASEYPLTTLLTTSFKRAVVAAGGSLDIRATDNVSVQSLVNAKTYDVVFVRKVSGPDFCYTCTFGESAVAQAADGGDRNAQLRLEQSAKDNGELMLLWREKTVVASRGAAVDGVVANGYASSVASDATGWWKP